MKTTTQTYQIRIEYQDGTVEQFNRTMPTKPTTIKGQSAQNDRVCKWVENLFASLWSTTDQDSTACNPS